MSLVLCFTHRRLVDYKEASQKRKDNDIVNYVRKNKVTKVGDGDEDYVIEELVVEESRCNRQKYISSHSSDVGVMNILNKVRMSGDFSLLNQTHADISEELQDYTNAPSNIGDGLRAVKSGANSFEGLKAIFGDISFEKLANMSPEDIQKQLISFVDSRLLKKKVLEKSVIKTPEEKVPEKGDK